MRMYDIIAKKRDKGQLSKEEIEYFIKHYVKGNIPDYQASSLLMAIYLNGMSDDELVDLTIAMANSSGKFDLSKLDKIIVDKHSTGGVGDKVSLIVLVCVACLGLTVAKMSGRGLGFTGGTIDKLESIEGMKLDYTFDEFINNINKNGMCLMMQTSDINIADKKLYALRDTTATVASMPLIASSIMSKKIASGANKLVLDVTVGTGAFMKNEEEATHLANQMVKIGSKAGIETVAILTSMNEPIGKMVGNSLEIMEVIEFLKSNTSKRESEMNKLNSVVLEIGAYMLKLGNIFDDIETAKMNINKAIDDMRAYNMFEKFIVNQGGNIEVIRNTKLLPKARNKVAFKSTKSGYITMMDCENIGKASVVLGAGREHKDDKIDYSVGIEMVKKIGDIVEENDTLMYIYYNNKIKYNAALKYLNKSIIINENEKSSEKTILKVIE